MLELNGKYNTCKIFTDNIEKSAIGQLMALLNQECIKGSKIRIMPDVQGGRGCVIGTAMTLTDKVIPNLVGVDIGCVDKDTEFLSTDGWHKISEYNNQKIAVYDLDSNSTRFEYPNAFIKNPESEFYHFKTKYGIDQMVSKEHRCLIRRGNQNRPASRDLPYVLTAQEIYEKHNRVKIGFRDNFICEIPSIQNDGLDISDEYLRVIVMYSADGQTSHTSNLLSVNFKKSRKIERCKLLLSEAKIPFKETVHKDITTITFRFDYDIKDMSCLYGLSKNQLSIICDEVMYWDGNIDSMQYTSTIKNNVDFVQYAFACNGYRTSIDLDRREEKYKNGVCYRLSVASSRPRVQLAGKPKTPITVEKSIDGFKYCFNTSTGFWIMRRNGCICITGNCGMSVFKLKEKRIDLPKLDSVIRKNVPSGSYTDDNIMRSTRHSLTSELSIEDLALIGKRHAKVKLDKAFLSCGTLGGGNHFIEVDKDSEDNLYLVIHTGSRLLGMEICNYYQQEAYDRYTSQDYNKEYARLLAETPPRDRNKVLTDLRKNKNNMLRTDIPFELAYCEGDLLDDYLHDMKITQDFASLNRKIIASVILKNMKLHSVDEFETIHNYIDIDNMILRKGSVSAQEGEKLIIPMNMRDGSLICVGKGNPDWNYSAPHGAGRLMARGVAKNSISMTKYKESMRGIYTTSVSQSTVDESPMAYKPMQEIIDNIQDTVEVLDIIKPIYNFKAS